MSRLGNLKFVKQSKSWLIWVLIMIGIVRFVVHNVLMVSYVPSASMQDTMMIGEKFLCVSTYFLDDIKHGDIVVFYPNKEEEPLAPGYWVKRVIGLPGDKINIKDGIVYVNGVEQREEYVHHQEDYTASFTVPAGKYFLCGDNRAGSWDARKWGNPFISRDQIKFKVLFRVSPLSKFGNVYKEKSYPVSSESGR